MSLRLLPRPSHRLSRSLAQWGVMVACTALAWFWLNQMLSQRGLTPDFSFLGFPAGFDMSESLTGYTGEHSYTQALLAGTLNTLKVSAVAIVLASCLGLMVALGRLSSNPLLSSVASGYVELTRNVPLLLQLFAWYAAITVGLPGPRQALHPLPGVLATSRGFWFATLQPTWDTAALLAAATAGLLAGWFVLRQWQRRHLAAGSKRRMHRSLTVRWLGSVAAGLLGAALAARAGAVPAFDMPHLVGFSLQGGMYWSAELAALTAGLSVYTSGSLAEVFRGAIMSVPQGQIEAAESIGLGPLLRLRLVVMPQAMRVAIPPTTSQYINIIKNSSLGVAIGYPDLMSVGNTVINQTGQALAMVAIFMAIYLALGFAVTLAMRSLLVRVDRHA